MKRIIPWIVALLLSTYFPPALAETKIFVKEYTYQASEVDSKVSCRTIALEQVKRLLLEELGIYLESHTETVNFQLTKDQIITFTAGIVQTQIQKEKWDGEKYWIQAKIEADPKGVVGAVNLIRKDMRKIRDLEEARKKVEELSSEIARLKKELAIDRTNQNKIAKYMEAVEGLNALGMFRKGIELSISGKLHEAIQIFNEAIQKNPQYALAYVVRGHLYIRLGKNDMAIQDSSRAIELDPDFALAYANRAYIHYRLRDYANCLKDSNRAIELDPEFALAYVLRGGSFYGLNNYKKALENAEKAIELNPNNALSYVNRGVDHMALGNKIQAYWDIEKAVDLDPNCPEVLIAKAELEINSGNFSEGLNFINKAIKLDPYLAISYYNRGVAYFKMGDKNLALTDLDRAIELAPKFTRARALRANIK